jgi:ssDNA-binding Zn-finger/Zn-ribbon topoisomerase 1
MGFGFCNRIGEDLIMKKNYSKQLAPCPKCGGKMEFQTGGMGFFFVCSDCGEHWNGGILTTHERDKKIKQAIKRWNNRKEAA